MDRFGIDTILPFADRVDTVATLCARGHANKMVLSHDAACFNDWLPERDLPAVLPNWHYLHIHNDVIPALKKRGVTDEQIRTMLVDNPRASERQNHTKVGQALPPAQQLNKMLHALRSIRHHTRPGPHRAL